MIISKFSKKAHVLYNFLHKLEPKVEVFRLTNPIPLFSHNKIINTVPNSTFINDKNEITTLYKVIHH